ncbi:hypothetical protein [Nocardioides perillae]|uniref:Peptidase MA superfamily protein n=1 Tax=Nocardioides perillae TaxID=1119534 RepID=A0A7Y9RWY9_9ACTN|nr:hypothetical protein [Nocardioides perillae]NYG56298.1 hypothetical protein [Nocardioides perillae]
MVLLVAAVVAVLALRDDTYVAPTPTAPSVAAARPAEAAAALDALARALEDGSPEAAAAVAPPGDETAAARLAAVADDASALGVGEVDLRYVDALGPVGNDGSWTAEADATWSFAGFDTAPVRAEVQVALRVVGDAVGVVGFVAPAAATDGVADDRLPLWLTGAVEVSRADDVLVLAADDLDLERYARLARAAVAQVREVLPGWRTGLVVQVPSSAEALRAALAADERQYAAVAAVTTTVGDGTDPAAPVHVFVNPEVFDGLDPRGAQVVMTHEAVHVATDAPRADVPLWLLEGFADHVALRDVDLPVTTTAGQVIAQVREDGVPAALPGPAEFDTSATHLGATYEAAWLACEVVADAAGPDALVELYRRVDAGEDVEAVLRDVAGFGLAGLTQRWQERLRAVAA